MHNRGWSWWSFINLFRQEPGVVCLPVESSYNSAEDHCAVLGALFCLGHDLNTDVIFEGRWTKPFVPAIEKDFIENPCEMFSDSDLPIVSFQKSDESLEKEGVALPLQEVLNDEPLAILFKHISQLTGFPISSLKPQHRLLDDLNLDSIKRFEIIERFAKDMHLSGDVGQIQADISLADLVATIVEKAKNTHDQQFESHLSPWVAAFEEFVTPETELVAQAHPWQNSDVLLVCDRQNFDQIKMKLDDLAITPKMLTQIDRNIKIDEHINHLCIFLPKAKSPGSLKNFLLDLAAVLPYEGSLLIIDSHNAANSENFDDVASWCASIHLERANLRIRHVCIQDEYIDFANAILELSDDLPYRKVFYKDGERSKTTYRYVYPKKYIERNPNLVLVTGGGKGITAQCALALAEKTKGIYILLGRSAVDDEIRSTLSKFKNLEVAVKYIQCDITNMNSVAEAIEQVISNFGKVDWLVHGAGYNSPQLIEKSDRIQVEKEMGAKLNGLSNILNALPQPPDRVIAITSIIGMLGMPGNAWYAYANASLHRFMEHWQQKHRNSSVLSLAYSVWNEIGMGARLGSVKRLSQLGVSALPVNMATKHFVGWALSNTGECRQVILMGRMKSELFDTWHQFPSPFQGRFVGEPHSEFQEVELVTDIKISLDSDPYLKDHKFGESFLFPTVFGLEAMAQGICRLLGKRPNDFSVHNLLLKKPILVMDGEEQVIRIHTYRTGADSFESAIYAKSSGFAKPHFSGSWTLSGIDYEQLNILDEPLNIDPSEVLYNKILFQGPLFQKIDKICMLNSREAVVKTNGGISDKSNWHLDIDSFVLGSPYRRDSLLQCGQLSITPRIGLPYKIDHWHLDCQNGARTIRSFITEDKTSSVLGDVWALKENRVVEKISGYAIKTIRTDQTLPNPEQILEADQDSRSNKFSDSKLSQLTSLDWENLTPSYYSFKEINPGTRGERRFRYRFPLSFSSVTEPSGTASLAEMAHWLGNTRELSLRPGGLYAAASRHVATNQFAWVTKETEFRVVGDVSAEDIIEVDFWTERIYGPESADVEMIYKWYKLVGDGSRAPVAECIQTTTWTEIVGHGLVVPASYPSDMQPFLESVLPPQRAKQEGLSWKVPNVLGEQLWQSPEPWRGHLLYKADFRTTSRNSNMVKNVYWANYTDWMIETRDLWLNDHMCGQFIELRTQTAHIQHMREAMVGDKIQVHMSVISVYEKGLDLAFDIYRIESPVALSKLARISQKAICLRPNKDGYWDASNLEMSLSRMIPKLNSMPRNCKREQEL
ncbi:MAG: SDR family NAD(P)-dependent oxidoreductase [Bdellovibrionota bacterium]